MSFAHTELCILAPCGLFARACFRARHVGVLVFSDHRGVLDADTAARARSEFAENVAWLRTESGADVRDHSNQMLPACRGAFQSERGVLYAAMEALRNDYDLVVTHAPGEPWLLAELSDLADSAGPGAPDGGAATG